MKLEIIDNRPVITLNVQDQAASSALASAARAETAENGAVNVFVAVEAVRNSVEAVQSDVTTKQNQVAQALQQASGIVNDATLQANKAEAAASELTGSLDILLTNTKQLSDNSLMQNRSLSGTTGNFGAISNNWVSLPYQPITSGLHTASGFAGAGTTVARYVIKNALGEIVLSENAKGILNTDPVTFTVPSGDDHTIAFNIASGSNVWNNVDSYRLTFMLNTGPDPIPIEDFGKTFNKEKAGLISKLQIAYLSAEGNDDNSGISELSPVLSFSRVKEILSEEGELIIMQGDYFNPAINLSDFKYIKSKRGDRVRFIYGSLLTSGSLLGGYTRVYSTPYTPSISSSYFLWQHDIEDEKTVISLEERHPLHRGRRTRLPSTRIYPASSIAQIESTTDKLMWYKSGSTLYFSKGTGSNLLLNPIVVPNNSSLSLENEKRIYIDNIDILYKPLSTFGMSGKLTDVSVGMTNISGSFLYDKTIGLDFERCEAFGCVNDGFNGHVFNNMNPFPYTRQLQVKFTDCYSHDNGDDGDSGHEFSLTSIYGGLYEYNGNGVTTAVGGHATPYYAMSRKNGAHPWTNDQGGYGFSTAGDSADNGIGTNIHCFGCISIGDRISFKGQDNSSKFINCISKGAVVLDFGAGEKINCVTL